MNKIAIAFPGQNAQYTGMGKALCEKNTIANQTFEEASDYLGQDIKQLCFEGPDSELGKTVNTQVCILTASVAAFRTYMELTGKKPSIMLGHSFGEISALTCAGAIAFQDALQIAKIRAAIAQEAFSSQPGVMKAVIGVPYDMIEQECRKASSVGDIVNIANYNTESQVVICGMQQAVEKVSARMEEMNARVISLKVSSAFHSPLMKKASTQFEQELKRFTFHEFDYPVLSSVTVKPYCDPLEVPKILVRQLYSPVKWTQCINFVKDSVDCIVDIGPGNTFKKMEKHNSNPANVLTFDDEMDREKIALEYKEERKDTYESFLGKCLAISSSTENRNKDVDEYQNGVIKAYNELRNRYLKALDQEESETERNQAICLLDEILRTKKMPDEERENRLTIY